MHPIILRLNAAAAAAILAVTSFHIPRHAQANIGEAFGFGSRTASLAGAGAAWGFDAFAAYANPAGLPFATPKSAIASHGGPKRLGVGLGLLLASPSFLAIENVNLENNFISDKTPPRTGNVDTDYRDTFGQSIGLTYLLSESSRATAGITVFLPITSTAYMDTGETFVPEYVLYRARTQRPQVELGGGLSLSRSFHAGAGIHLAFSLSSNATVFLNSDPAKPSAMRFSSSLKPKASPYLGLLYTPLENPETFSLGLVLRAQATSDNTMVLNSAARLFGTLAALDFNFTALSALYFDPHTAELGMSWEHAPGWRLYAQADYQAWRLFKAPALIIQSPDITSCSGSSCGVAISPGNNPGFAFQNILIPRVAEEITSGSLVYRVGYAYRPSILKDLPTGAGNYLDPPKHMISAGVGLLIKKFLGYDQEARLDINAAYHQLVKQEIRKTPGDEAGNGTGDLKIGAPGYDAGGKILGGGVSLSLAI